jgi:hypothetical protein
MTRQDYENKKKKMMELSSRVDLIDSETIELLDLIMEVSIYEANNGLIDENEFKKD